MKPLSMTAVFYGISFQIHVHNISVCITSVLGDIIVIVAKPHFSSPCQCGGTYIRTYMQ